MSGSPLEGKAFQEATKLEIQRLSTSGKFAAQNPDVESLLLQVYSSKVAVNFVFLKPTNKASNYVHH